MGDLWYNIKYPILFIVATYLAVIDYGGFFRILYFIFIMVVLVGGSILKSRSSFNSNLDIDDD
tara:strand:- start:3988 stop:4176 length:189 start_codon:yes stop_codon:yes gene_type:complete